jgi:queuine tRNA-ribosyltransferase
VRHLYLSDEILAHRLLTLHNLTYFKGLMTRVRDAIISGGYAAFVKAFMAGPEARTGNCKDT